jgi:arsenical pump membrane protein
MRLQESLRQVWPAFVLVTGLLLIGLVGESDGLFARAGSLLGKLRGPPWLLMLAAMMLVTLVTAILNLDTSVVFLTPVLVYAARQRGLGEEPLLFGAIYMSNASSLYLPGSNLTNLLVFGHDRISGGSFLAAMFPSALAATLATVVGLLVMFRIGREPSRPPDSGAGAHARPSIGLAAATAAAILMVTLRNPALEVLAIGLLSAAVQIVRQRLNRTDVLRAIGPVVLLSLFLLSVTLGIVARSWSAPAELLGHSGSWATAAIGALAAITINNLPAAVLLSARAPAHPYALLLGLNIAPNLAVSGSLSVYLWFRIARQLGHRPSPLTFSRRGLILAPLALLCALAANSLLPLGL